MINIPQQCHLMNLSDDYWSIYKRTMMEIAIDLESIKQTLEEQRQNLAAFVDKKQNSQHEMEISNPDQAERAMDSRDKNREKLLLDHVERQLEELNQALNRMEGGTYGICTSCGENIQAARLDIMPSAALCIECQRSHDQK